MKIRKTLLALLIATSAISAGAHAEKNIDPARAVKDAISKMPGTPPVKEVSATPSGLYEVVLTNNKIIYMTADTKYVMVGEIFETPEMKNLTTEKYGKLLAIQWDALPLKGAIVEKKGNGKDKLFMITDPSCGYCRKMERELEGMTNLTIYRLPVGYLGVESSKKAKALWCAKDPLKAYKGYMEKDPKTSSKESMTLPEAPETCKDPIGENTGFATKIGITGTPTIFFADGSRHDGMIPRTALEEILKKQPKEGADTTSKSKEGQNKRAK